MARRPSWNWPRRREQNLYYLKLFSDIRIGKDIFKLKMKFINLVYSFNLTFAESTF